MISAYTPLSSVLLLLAGSFCFCFLLTGLTISLIQQRLSSRRVRSADYIALMAAQPLGLIVFVLIEGGIWLILSRFESFFAASLLIFGLLVGAGLLLIISLLPKMHFWHNQFMALALLFAASLLLVLTMPPAELIFDGVFAYPVDRLLGTLMVFGAGLMFLRFEKVDGSGMTAMVVLGLGFLCIPLFIQLVSTFHSFFGASPLTPAVPAWPNLWFCIGLLLVGVGLGVLYWVFLGYGLFLGFEGRLANGFLFALLVLELALLTSPFVVLLLFLFYICCYGIFPLVARFAYIARRAIGSTSFWSASFPRLRNWRLFQQKRRATALDASWRFPLPSLDFRGGDVLEHLLIQSTFILLAAAAFFWPLTALASGIAWTLVMVWWFRWRSS